MIIKNIIGIARKTVVESYSWTGKLKAELNNFEHHCGPQMKLTPPTVNFSELVSWNLGRDVLALLACVKFWHLIQSHNKGVTLLELFSSTRQPPQYRNIDVVSSVGCDRMSPQFLSRPISRFMLPLIVAALHGCAVWILYIVHIVPMLQLLWYNCDISNGTKLWLCNSNAWWDGFALMTSFSMRGTGYN